MLWQDTETEVVQVRQLLGDLTSLLRGLSRHIFAMPLLIPEEPQSKEIVPDGVHDREEARKATRVRHAMSGEVLILETDPVTRDKAAQQVQPS